MTDDDAAWLAGFDESQVPGRPRVNPHQTFTEEMQIVPAEMRKFLVRDRRPSSYDKTWENFSGAYGEAFDLLSGKLLAEWHGSRLALPLFFLCRHSIELSIKRAIIEYAGYAGETPDLQGHSLARLWNELMRQVEAAGFRNDDLWTAHCGKLVRHLHDVDPDGERFRYPTNRSGAEFECTKVDVERLAVAHWHIGVLCDALGEMLQAIGHNRVNNSRP